MKDQDQITVRIEQLRDELKQAKGEPIRHAAHPGCGHDCMGEKPSCYTT